MIVTTIQLVAQYTNEYFDIEVDRLNGDHRTWFSGGSGVLPSGEVDPNTLKTVCIILVLVSLSGVLVCFFISPWMACIALVNLAASLFYSAPPLSLMSSGLGELTASITVAIFVPLTGYILQTNRIDPPLLLACIPLFLIHYAMLVAFEIPDWQADQQAAKRTISVRLGLKTTAFLHDLAVLLGVSGFLYFFIRGDEFARYLIFSIPIAIWQLIFIPFTIWKPSVKRYYLLTTGAISLFAFSACLILLAVIPGL
jgi:1,4-dihydroxy-2-naphthoate octaprenyltransferase